jgi:hypothetical protein
MGVLAVFCYWLETSYSFLLVRPPVKRSQKSPQGIYSELETGDKSSGSNKYWNAYEVNILALRESVEDSTVLVGCENRLQPMGYNVLLWRLARPNFILFLHPPYYKLYSLTSKA